MNSLRIFLAGATGTLGRRLVPQLVDRGHHVIGTTRSRPDDVRALGAEPVVLDPLDAAAVREAVARRAARRRRAPAHRTVARSSFGRNFDKAFAMTNRLRTEGTDHLLAAAREAGVTRLVWQSYAGWPYAREGDAVKGEDAPLDPDPPADVRETLAAIKHLEAVVTEAGGTVLRYGGFYGPGTSMTEGGEHAELLRKRRFPVGGNGAGVWSLVHIDDAAAATVAAIESGTPGIFNVVDDEPAPAAELAPGAGRRLRRPAPAPPARLAREARRRRADALDDDPHPRRLERQGEARAGLAARGYTWRTPLVRREVRVPVAEHAEGLPERALGLLLVQRLVDARRVQRVDRRRQRLDLPRRRDAPRAPGGAGAR